MGRATSRRRSCCSASRSCRSAASRASRAARSSPSAAASSFSALASSGREGRKIRQRQRIRRVHKGVLTAHLALAFVPHTNRQHQTLLMAPGPPLPPAAAALASPPAAGAALPRRMRPPRGLPPPPLIVPASLMSWPCVAKRVGRFDDVMFCELEGGARGRRGEGMSSSMVVGKGWSRSMLRFAFRRWLQVSSWAVLLDWLSNPWAPAWPWAGPGPGPALPRAPAPSPPCSSACHRHRQCGWLAPSRQPPAGHDQRQGWRDKCAHKILLQSKVCWQRHTPATNLTPMHAG